MEYWNLLVDWMAEPEFPMYFRVWLGTYWQGGGLLFPLALRISLRPLCVFNFRCMWLADDRYAFCFVFLPMSYFSHDPEYFLGHTKIVLVNHSPNAKMYILNLYLFQTPKASDDHIKTLNHGWIITWTSIYIYIGQ